MLGKKTGKHSFGFNDSGNTKKKEKEKTLVGSVKVCHSFSTIKSILTLVSGCLCNSMRQFRHWQFVDGSNLYVEHAIRHPAQKL